MTIDLQSGDRIRLLRRAQKLTQRELGQRAGIRYCHLGAVESGLSPLWPAWRRRLAAALGCDEADLLGDAAGTTART